MRVACALRGVRHWPQDLLQTGAMRSHISAALGPPGTLVPTRWWARSAAAAGTVLHSRCDLRASLIAHPASAQAGRPASSGPSRSDQHGAGWAEPAQSMVLRHLLC